MSKSRVLWVEKCKTLLNKTNTPNYCFVGELLNNFGPYLECYFYDSIYLELHTEKYFNLKSPLNRYE